MKRLINNIISILAIAGAFIVLSLLSLINWRFKQDAGKD